jgi:type IV pilus assembly protein PilW
VTRHARRLAPLGLRSRARGMTLVELMISLALGVLTVLAGGALLVFSNGSYVNLAEAARLNDNAMFAHEILSRAIRQSAFVEWGGATAAASRRPNDSASVSGLDARSVSRGSDGIETPTAATVNGSDVLALRYSGSGAGPGGDGSVINCAGFGVASAASEAERGWSIFYVAINASGDAELRCKYRGANSWGAEAIVGGVDSFQVLYGLDTDEPADGVANRYLNASALNALDEALVLAGGDAAARARDKQIRTHWKRVVSLKVALLLHGERASQADGAPQRFDLFGQPYADAYAGSDPGVRIDEARLPPELRGRVRHLLTWTILLRNRS